MNQEERLIPEVELLKSLGLKKQELDRLRTQKGFPYVKFSMKSRAYFLSDVLEWGKSHRVVSDSEK